MGVGYRKERRGGSAQEEAVMASMMEDSRVLGFLFGTDEMRAVWSLSLIHISEPTRRS